MNAPIPMKLLDTGDIRTCEVRLSFPELFVAKAPDAEKPNDKFFSTAILFPPGADLSVLEAKIKEIAKAEFPDKPLKSLRIGLRDQGEKEFEGYVDGAFFLNCKSKNRPPVVDRKRQPLVDEQDVYPGIYAIVTLRAYAFKPKKGDKFGPGIGFGLQAVQITRDGERLGGGYTDPNDVFEELPDLEAGESADSIFGGKGADDNDSIFGTGA